MTTTVSAESHTRRAGQLIEDIGLGHSVHIGGEWRKAGGGEMEIRSPATNEPLARIGLCSTHDVDDAVEAARVSFTQGAWKKTTLDERADIFEGVAKILKDNQGALSELESLDSGGTLRRTLIDPLSRYFRDVAHMLRRYEAERALPYASRPVPSFNLVCAEPIGVCALITPWNYPAIMAAFKLGPALAMGNSVVLKPAVEAPLTTIRVVEAFLEAGIPPGVLNLVQGDGVPVGEHLVAHPAVDKVAFTGSTETGKRIMELASPTIKNLTLELGGKSPNIIMADADMEQALEGSLFAIYLHSGQICVSGSRLLVPRASQEEIGERLTALSSKIRLGDPLDMNTDMGPVISGPQLKRVLAYVSGARKEGAEILVGGKRPANLPEELAGGFYLEPTIVGNVRNDMQIAREEVFGPVLSIIPYSDVEEAIALANDTTYGLAAGIWSRDVPKAISLARELRAGTVWINDWHMLRHDAPYGGYRQSGIGREHGTLGFEQYVEHKHIHVSLSPTSYKILFGNK